jgi:RNA polymerase sigma factor (sigma-70 family)
MVRPSLAYGSVGGSAGPHGVTLDEIDVGRLAAGDKRTWDAFVAAAAPLIHAVARRVLAAHGHADAADVLDTAQDVFVRVCAGDFRLIRTYDPARASFATWLAVVARSAAIDHLRRRRPALPLEDVPEHALAVEDRRTERLEPPPGLLTARQALVLRLLYDRDLDVTEIAALLRVDPQTVRSTHHKAMLRLREHFGASQDRER